MKTSIAAFACAGAGLGAGALAGPLNPAWVPDDVRWVVHIDVEAGLKSALGAYAAAHKNEFDGLDDVKTETGIDPFSDIKGITVFGASADPRTGMAVIDTTAAADQLIERARAKGKTFDEIKEGSLTLFTWNDNGGTRYAQVRPGKSPDQRVIIVGSDKDRLLAGIHVLDGEAPSLSKKAAGPLSERPRPGSVLFVAATHLGEAEAVMLQRADSLVLDVGEEDHEVFADLTVVPKSTEDATKLVQAMQGAVALASMWMQGDPECAQVNAIMQGIKFGSQDGRVQAHLRVKADQVLGAAGELKSMKDSQSENAHPRHKRRVKNESDEGRTDR